MPRWRAGGLKWASRGRIRRPTAGLTAFTIMGETPVAGRVVKALVAGRFFMPVRLCPLESPAARAFRRFGPRMYWRSLTVRCIARAVPVAWRSVMSMPSTVTLNCMTGHRIIYTIPAAITGTMTSQLAPRRRAMIFPWGLRSDRVSLPAGMRALVR